MLSEGTQPFPNGIICSPNFIFTEIVIKKLKYFIFKNSQFSWKSNCLNYIQLFEFDYGAVQTKINVGKSYIPQKKALNIGK